VQTKPNKELRNPSETQDNAAEGPMNHVKVALLTGGGDKPYVFGLATELISKRVAVDIVGSDELDFREFHDNPDVRFFNLRGDQRPDVGQARKVIRVLMYYAKLIRYAATSKPRIFHILWNNKFQYFDRTLLMLYYRLFGKQIVLTLHNVNVNKRDGNDSFLNRLTLRVQYWLADHIFVHTEKMKEEVIKGFEIQPSKVTIIPFGINNALPITELTPLQARLRLGILEAQKVILFFGNIAPYKGLEYLIEAFQAVRNQYEGYRLIIAGRPKGAKEYWAEIHASIREDVEMERILLKAEYIPDAETEVYFKAADILVLPYKHIYQSGVLFLGYSFGLPVLAADVGSLKAEIIEGRTGFVFKSGDSTDLARFITKYFASDLFKNLDQRRQEIKEYAAKRYSWDIVGQRTMKVYMELLRSPVDRQSSSADSSKTAIQANTPQ
jgi:D-inositol-3-phosphate glycosyltransferase